MVSLGQTGGNYTSICEGQRGGQEIVGVSNADKSRVVLSRYKVTLAGGVVLQ